MSKLDEFEALGEPIHPYDVFELLESLPEDAEIVIGNRSPVCENETDYLRNIKRIGETITIAGKIYFQTTTTVPKTKRFS
jgi:uncharacterized protein YifE (UPF0438 family)